MDARRALSKIWERSLRAGHWSGRAWTERAEDGRIRYAMAGAGVGLITGSFTTTVDNTAGVTWAGLRVASISLVGFGLGPALLAITLVWPWIDEEWAWERRRKTARQRLITEADDDPEFREELKADPRQAFEREFARKTPDDSEITVLEQTPKHVYIVLQPSVLSRGPAASTSRAARWCECAWTERTEDGRVSYATAACGLGLLVGSVVAVIGDNAPLINWTGFGLAPLSFLGFCVGVGLLAATFVRQSSSDEIWSWERRSFAERIIARANCDRDFREQLKADWRRTVEKCRGTVRDGVEITVLEETPTRQYIVLEPPVLPREQLDAPSGHLSQSTASTSEDTNQ